MIALGLAAVVAVHDTHQDGNIIPFAVFLGAVATVGWLAFSRLRWRNTVLVAVAAWVLGGVLAFGL